LQKNNVHFLYGTLERLPFERASFDRVLCYSVLNLVPYEKAIDELARVTRSGGLLYINANSVGRFVHDIVHPRNPAPDFDPRRYSALTLWNTFSGRRSGLSPQAGGLVIFRARLGRLLARAGFDVIAAGPEGTLLGGSEPFLAASYLGLPSAFDVLARRN
jgi:SAM-dependent methyltransferase